MSCPTRKAFFKGMKILVEQILVADKCHNMFYKMQVQHPRITLDHHQIIPHRLVTTCTLKLPGLENMATRHGWWAETSKQSLQAHHPANCASFITCMVTQQKHWPSTSGLTRMELECRKCGAKWAHREPFGTERWCSCLPTKTSRFNFTPF